MPSHDGRYWVTFNGEILNHHVLRKRLEIAGHAFRTHTDTEVLLAAYAHWGRDCLHRFRGFFAFVLFDRGSGQLFAARDRFGIKPLYLWRGPQGLAFASEIKQFLALDGFRPQVNSQALIDYLASGLFDHTTQTFFANVQQLSPGACMRLDLDGGVVPPAAQEKRWYSLRRSNEGQGKRNAPEAEFLQLLRNAVSDNLIADVPPGVALSGGLDSSAVACLAAQQTRASHQPLRAFTIAFEDVPIAEGRYARLVSAAAGAVARIETLSAAQALERIDPIVWHFDEPILQPNMLAQWRLFELFRQAGVKVALTGQGGDELLGGYPFMAGTQLARLLVTRGPRALRREASALNKMADPRHTRRSLVTALLPGAILDDLWDDHPRHARGWRRFLRGHIDYALLRARSPRALRDGRTPRFSGIDLSGLSRSLLTTTNIPMLLHYEDRTSMAHGVEARPVFLDHHLVEYCLQLEPHFKLHNGQTKVLMRRALRHIVPAEVLARTDKLGFPVPEPSWRAGPLQARLRRDIEEAIARFPDEIAHIAELKALRRQLAQGDLSNLPVWRLTGIGTWGRLFDVSA